MAPSCRRGMKARPFLAMVLALLLLALGLGGALWWQVWQRSPLQLQHRALALPRAARFVPRDAPLALYLLTDGSEPVAYARALAPSRARRQAADGIERLRDGAFAAAGLDYRNELAGWLAPEISLALFDPPTAALNGEPRAADPLAGGDWLLALRSRDDVGARRFVQRFWQTRSLAGTDLQVSSYRGMGLISGRGALVGRRAVPLATALVDDDLLLIASGRGVLEQALDVSQLAELNQAADPQLGARLDRLGAGVALLVARGGGPGSLLGLPATSLAAGPPPRWLASLRPDGTSLRLEALLERSAAGGSSPAAVDGGQRRQLLAAAPPRSGSLALFQDPASLLQDPFLGQLVERAAALESKPGPLLPVLLARADGPLLAAEAPAGWLMASPQGRPAAESLETPLAAAGLIAAPLEVEGRSVTVWTRLETGGRSSRPDREGVDRLQAPLEGWRAERDGLALWGRSLALLERDPEGRGARARERQLEALDLAAAPFQWALDADPARRLLGDWIPWRRLSALAGGPLDGSVQGLAVALEPGAEVLRIRGRLELGPAL